MFLTTIVSTLAFAFSTSGSGWLTDYEKALAKAAETDKLVLADFTGSDWCGWCIKLHDEVFDEPAFKKWAEENVVLLELDFPRSTPQNKKLKQQNARLARQFGVRAYPTVLLLDVEGKQVARTGYVKGGPARWIAKAEELLAAARAEQEAAEAWLTSYEAAMKAAKESGKPVLVDFTGSDWCGWCIKLHDEVFSKPAFREWAEENVILLELDFPRRTPQSAELKKQNAALAKKYGVRGYPTVLFLDANGEIVGRSGYKPGGPELWTADADKQLRAPRR